MSREHVIRLLEALSKGDPDAAERARREINERHPPRLAGAMTALSHQRALSLANKKPDHGRTIEDHADEVVTTATEMEKAVGRRGRSC